MHSSVLTDALESQRYLLQIVFSVSVIRQVDGSGEINLKTIIDQK